MTREEFYRKYGDVKVKFWKYYKYTLWFSAPLPDGNILTCGYGGIAEEIYRRKVVADKEEKVININPYCGSVYDGDTLIDNFYDYF